jgi:hypothetical protein
MECFGLLPTWMDISWLMGTLNGLCIIPRNNYFTLIGDHKGTLFNYMTTISGMLKTMKGLFWTMKRPWKDFSWLPGTMKGHFWTMNNHERILLSY